MANTLKLWRCSKCSVVCGIPSLAFILFFQLKIFFLQSQTQVGLNFSTQLENCSDLLISFTLVNALSDMSHCKVSNSQAGRKAEFWKFGEGSGEKDRELAVFKQHQGLIRRERNRSLNGLDCSRKGEETSEGGQQEAGRRFAVFSKRTIQSSTQPSRCKFHQFMTHERTERICKIQAAS